MKQNNIENNTTRICKKFKRIDTNKIESIEKWILDDCNCNVCNKDNYITSILRSIKIKKEDNDSNGLEEFGLNKEEPNLFDTSTNNLSSEEELNHEQPEDNSEEDDYEIPAFLRRQKN